MTRATICVMALVVVFPSYGSAQAAPSPGDRIRIKQMDGTVLTGTLTMLSPETIQLSVGSDDRMAEVPVAQIEVLETSLGRRATYGKYVPLSMLGGAFVGAAYGAITGDPSSTGFSSFDQPGFRAFAGFVYGAIIGLPLGVIIGSLVTEERWNPVALPAPAASGLTIRPVIGSGVGLAGSFRVGGF